MMLLDYARDEVGMPVRGFHIGRHVGWTTDPAKADLMREAGATVTGYAHAGWAGGWEVSFAPGAERQEPVPA